MGGWQEIRVPRAFVEAMIHGAMLLSQDVDQDDDDTVQLSEMMARIRALPGAGSRVPAAELSLAVEAVQGGIACLEAATHNGIRMLEPLVRSAVGDSLDVIGSTPAQVERLAADVAALAQQQLVDEIRLGCGMSQVVARGRVEFATDDPRRIATMQRRMASGSASWYRVRRVYEQTLDLPAAVADSVAHEVLAPGRDGRPVTASTFTRRLRIQLALRRQVAADTARDKFAPDLAADCGYDGMGRLTVSGDSARVAAGFDRCDRIARRLRHAGDRRSLGELRVTVALDLILYGSFQASQQSFSYEEPAADVGADPWPADALVPPGQVLGSGGELIELPDLLARPGALLGPDDAITQLGALPPATVHVVVSLASLVDASTDVGEIPGHCLLTAKHARELALAKGSVWRRLVTDPVDGYLVDLSTTYRPSTHLARTVRARDLTSRHPLSAVTASRADLDHVIAWETGGPTSRSNLVALNRSAHLAKTRGIVATQLHPDGSYTWTTPTRRSFTTYPHDYHQLQAPRPAATYPEKPPF